MTLLRSNVTPVGIKAPAAGVPAWWSGLNENTWAVVGTTGSGANSITQTQANPISPNPMAFGGAITVDQNTNELIHAAGGGHTVSDGPNNQVTALNLKSATPTWTRLWGPGATQSDQPSWTNTAYADGQPRACHHWGALSWANGNVVITSMQGMHNANSASSAAVYSWNRSTGPSTGWVYRGLMIPASLGAAGAWNFEASPGCYDSNSNCFYVFVASNVGNGCYRFTANTWTPTVYNIQTNPAYQYHSWAVAVPENHYAVTNDAFGGTAIYIIDTNNPGAGYTRRVPTGVPPYSGTSPQAGHVYHAPSKSIYGWYNSGRSIGKLSVPANGDFVNGAFAWSTLTASASGATPPNFGSTMGYTAVNIVQNMGDNRAALIVQPGPSASTYIYKLPAS